MPNISISEIKNSTVLVKVGFDLPSLDDYSRVLDTKNTVDLLLQNNNKLVLLSHWGRPKSATDTELSLQKMLPLLQKLLGISIEFVNQYSDFETAKIKIKSSENQIFLLENTRFDSSEKSKDTILRLELATKYAMLGDYFVDEAFSLSHRKEATNTELKNLLPWCFGLSFENEIKHLDSLKNHPDKPFVIIMAGSKLETKLPIINKMLPICDKLLVAGKLCFTFLQAAKELGLSKYKEVDFGQSEVELDFIPQAKKILTDSPDKIILPIDFVFADDQKNLVSSTYSGVKLALDIGAQSIASFIQELQKAKTVFWNGTIGYYEKEIFNQGNKRIGQFLADTDYINKIIGGGDTSSSLRPETLSKINFVSMGGGASLECLSKS